jgi:hypothetical protein
MSKCRPGSQAKRRYSSRDPEALMTLPHLATSCSRCAPIAAGVDSVGSNPDFSSCERESSVARMVEMCLFSSAIVLGVSPIERRGHAPRRALLMIYFDTSALVPVFIREPKSGAVIAWLESSDVFSFSESYWQHRQPRFFATSKSSTVRIGFLFEARSIDLDRAHYGLKLRRTSFPLPTARREDMVTDSSCGPTR